MLDKSDLISKTLEIFKYISINVYLLYTIILSEIILKTKELRIKFFSRALNDVFKFFYTFVRNFARYGVSILRLKKRNTFTIQFKSNKRLFSDPVGIWIVNHLQSRFDYGGFWWRIALTLDVINISFIWTRARHVIRRKIHPGRKPISIRSMLTLLILSRFVDQNTWTACGTIRRKPPSPVKRLWKTVTIWNDHCWSQNFWNVYRVYPIQTITIV